MKTLRILAGFLLLTLICSAGCHTVVRRQPLAYAPAVKLNPPPKPTPRYHTVILRQGQKLVMLDAVGPGSAAGSNSLGGMASGGQGPNTPKGADQVLTSVFNSAQNALNVAIGAGSVVTLGAGTANIGTVTLGAGTASVGTFTAGPSNNAIGGVSPVALLPGASHFNAIAATATATSTAFSVSGHNVIELYFTYGGTYTTNGSGCTIQVQGSSDGTNNATTSIAFPFVPNVTTFLSASAPMGISVTYIYACGTYPTGTSPTLTMKGVYKNGAPTNSAGQVIVNTEGQKPTYHYAGFVTPGAAPTDVIQLTGSASRTIRILSAVIGVQAGAAGIVDVALIRRSTANSAGTCTAGPTIGQSDIRDPAPTMGTSVCTANPTLGTTVANVGARKLGIFTSGGFNPAVFDFTTHNDKGLLLRGTSDFISVNGNGDTLLTGEVWSYDIIFDEENP